LLLVPAPVDVDSDVDANEDDDDDVDGELRWVFVVVGCLTEGLTSVVDLLVVSGSIRGFDEERPLGTFGALVLNLTALEVVVASRFICCEM